MTELHDLTALEQAAAIRTGEISPVELADHYLDRIAAHGAALGAFVTVTDEPARRAAKLAEQRVTDADDPAALPPFHGVPIGVKDLNLTAGIRTTFGSRLYEDFVPPVDDNVVTLLRGAGTVMLGKTNTPEFGLPCYTENAVAPPARTPYDTGRSAGGSSGGSAAAVAAGLLPFAQGSDGGGSIRIPASACGLVGIKPSRGRVSNGPLGGDITGLAWNGPLARTVADAAALLDVLGVPMPGDPHWAPPLPPGETFLGAAGREPGRLRIGRWIEPIIPGAVVAPECREAWEAASALLEHLGHEVADAGPPFGAEAIPMFETVWAVSANGVPVDPDRVGDLLPLTRWLRERGARIGATEYVSALGTLQMLARAGIVAAAEFDVVLTPTLAQLPAPVGYFTESVDPATDFDRQKRFTPYTALVNMTGQPAVSVPLHWTPAGLPVGVQLIGRPAAEQTLISLAAQLEAARPWRDRHPAQW
jgi:amidase